MIKYAKVVNVVTKACEVGLGTNEDFYKSIGMSEMDVEQCEWNNVWYLAGHCPEKPEPTHEEKVLELKKQLEQIDEKSARSMRAILAGTATDDDRAFLARLEEQAAELRRQIKELGGKA